MRLALDEARAAIEHDDVPVGAVIIDGEGAVVASAHNRREIDGDPTAHAEILAVRAAAAERGSWRLDGLTLVVTLEFRDEAPAKRFERYLKSGSGRAFAKRHFA